MIVMLEIDGHYDQHIFTRLKTMGILTQFMNLLYYTNIN